MKLSERPAATAKLIGGNLFVDFINTVGSRLKTSPTESIVRQEKINEYEDLLAWSQRVSILTEKEANNLLKQSRQRALDAEYVRQRAVTLREAIYRVCAAIINQKQPAQADFAILNQELSLARTHQQLAAQGKQIKWTWTNADNALDRMLWTIADSTAEFFTSSDLSRLHQCGGENCGWLFLDTSRNGRRQWCDMQTCGNLAKVRRFRARG